MTRTIPKSAAHAKKENALIFLADQSGLRSDHRAGTTWADRANARRQSDGGAVRVNMLSAVRRSNLG
jgi:hypothetical protein